MGDFIIGLILGSILGIVIMCFLVVGDEDNE